MWLAIIKSQAGASGIEYALVAALLAVATLASLSSTGISASRGLAGVENQLVAARAGESRQSDRPGGGSSSSNVGDIASSGASLSPRDTSPKGVAGTPTSGSGVKDLSSGDTGRPNDDWIKYRPRKRLELGKGSMGADTRAADNSDIEPFM